jgi:phosphocarrier protein FPr
MDAPELAAEDETPGEPAEEQARLDAALSAAGGDVDAARRQVASRGHSAEAEIFDAHRSLLADSALLAPARAAIAEGAAAGVAWVDAVRAAAGGLRALDDPLLRERAVDVEDVGARVLRHLRGAGDAPAGPATPGILVARDVTPGDAAALDPAVVQGLALAQGGATSHAAILARALGIPTVAGLGEAVLAIAPGTPLALDGDAGTLDVAPAGEVLAERERHAAAVADRRRRAREHAAEPARTRDGALIAVEANAGSPEDAVAAVAHGADGIGLLRTEFLFLDRADAPGEDEQRAVYAEIARTLDGRPLTIRTLDAGADKPLPFVAQAPEDNPFLGVRGIRLSLVNPELLSTQLRAIVAVAAEHPVRVMLPMVAAPAELREVRRLLDEALGGRGDGPPLGVMVEVPAVALAAERYAREAAFFSIGTNDLAQYTLAAERGNPAVADLLQGPHPGVLRLVEQVVAGAAAHGRSVSVCGELGGDPVAAVLLVGLGVRRLSAAAPRIPEVKAALRAVTLADAREAARAALDAEDATGAAAAAAPLLHASQAPSR